MRAVPFGPEAARALADEIDAAQRDDPLAAVVVVVSRATVGLAMRRLLASGDLGPRPSGRRGGVLNVRFVTLPGLADELGAPVLVAAGRQPASRRWSCAPPCAPASPPCPTGRSARRATTRPPSERWRPSSPTCRRATMRRSIG